MPAKRLPMVAAAIGLVIGGIALKAGGESVLAASPDAGKVFDDEDLAELTRLDLLPADSQPDIEAPSDGGYQRIAPRPPLSSSAPKPKYDPNQAKARLLRLFNPLATSAGLVEAQGYRIVLDGIDPLAVEETCTFNSRSWPCGVRARTEFRLWLRGRAIQCIVPPSPGTETLKTECRIGSSDLGAWLVANGWARATSGGPYREAGRTAMDQRRGIFGPPPARINSISSPAPSAKTTPDAGVP